MSDKITYVLRPYPHPSRELAKEQIDNSPDGYSVTIKDATRTILQNCAQWPYLEGFSKQLQWPVNGEKVWLPNEDYKDILTCAFEGEVNPRIAAGWNGGVVMLGRRTSDYGKKRFSEWYEWLMAAAALKGVTPVYKNGRSENDFNN